MAEAAPAHVIKVKKIHAPRKRKEGQSKIIKGKVLIPGYWRVGRMLGDGIPKTFHRTIPASEKPYIDELIKAKGNTRKFAIGRQKKNIQALVRPNTTEKWVKATIHTNAKRRK